jgi:hypothetical protein
MAPPNQRFIKRIMRLEAELAQKVDIIVFPI